MLHYRYILGTLVPTRTPEVLLPVSANDIIQVVANLSLFGQAIQNVFHLFSHDGGTQSQVVDDVSDFMDDFYLIINAHMSDAVDYDSVRVKNVTQGLDYGEVAWPTLVNGAYANDPLPNGVAALLTLPTNVAKCRGRKFLAGFGEGTTTDGLWVGSTLTDLGLAGDELLSDPVGVATGGDYTYGVVHKSGAFVPYTSAIASSIPAYQRRRKQGVGM